MIQLINTEWVSSQRKAQDRGNHRVYQTVADRKRAIKALVRSGFRYFVCYRDTAGIALSFCRRADWQHADSAPSISR